MPPLGGFGYLSIVGLTSVCDAAIVPSGRLSMTTILHVFSQIIAAAAAIVLFYLAILSGGGSGAAGGENVVRRDCQLPARGSVRIRGHC